VRLTLERKEHLVPVRNVLSVIIMSLLALSIGCSSKSRATPGEKAVRNFNKTSYALIDAQQKIDKTLQAMDQFQFTGNLQDQYRGYQKAVDDLEKCAKDAASLAKSMNENAPMYIEKWQKEMAAVKDPSVRASLEQRQEAVRSNVEALRASAGAAREAYEPFMAGLRDIEKALSINLSKGALPGLKPAMDKARADGKTLKARINVMQNQLSNMQQGRPATATAATAS
jgi:hypothetical protein